MSIGGRLPRTCAIAMTMSVWLMAGCNVNPFFLGQDGEGGGDGGPGEGNDGGLIYDAGPDSDGGDLIDADLDIDAGCVPTEEVCDGQDNDCDDAIDEGFNLDQDPANCGACGVRCSLAGTSGTCSAGECSFACLPGHHDLNGDKDAAEDSNGCEYLCLPTNGGEERCDFTDNNCNGVKDEGQGGESDVTDCGGCGNDCRVLFLNVPDDLVTCSASECGFTGCEEGFADVFDQVPGCEYECPVFPVENEECNNVDDDCNGIIDDGVSGGTLDNSCTDLGFEAFGETGACDFGTVVCSLGSEVCEGYVPPSAEVCNDIDDDCDGAVDEQWDKENDPQHCGSCDPCVLDDAIPGCSGGECTIAACAGGFVDLNNDASDGCEYECTPTGAEFCDGIDNDCDGLIDAADDNMVPAPANFCVSTGACADTTPTCGTLLGCATGGTATTWRCPYSANTEADECQILPGQELVCDGIDGDCNGQVDQNFILLGTDCDDGLLGACRGTGNFDCSEDMTDVTCIIDEPGSDAATQEFFCDNVDEDCDGEADEGAPDATIGIDRDGNGSIDYFIDAYEASRPDASGVSVGGAEHRSCSNQGALPWTNITWLEADLACARAGKRLCSADEWQFACEGTDGDVYPYGNTYDAFACNGNDFDQDCGVDGDADEALITGFAYGCPSPLATCEQPEFGTVDMSGNVKEWTGEGAVNANESPYIIRGGANDSAPGGMTCQFDFVSADEGFYFANLGFRCCSTP